jgi:hypothetical protein
MNDILGRKKGVVNGTWELKMKCGCGWKGVYNGKSYRV